MKVYYGITRLSQVFEMIEDVANALKGSSENVDNTIDLMIGTLAQETHLGTLKDPTSYVAGAGIAQFDPGIPFNDPVDRMGRWKDVVKKIFDFDFDRVQHSALEESPLLGIVLMRTKYKLVPATIPDSLEGQWLYYKRWYNSELGKATREEYMANFLWAQGLHKRWRAGKDIN
jgi:hypothetical protein